MKCGHWLETVSVSQIQEVLEIVRKGLKEARITIKPWHSSFGDQNPYTDEEIILALAKDEIWPLWEIIRHLQKPWIEVIVATARMKGQSLADDENKRHYVREAKQRLTAEEEK